MTVAGREDGLDGNGNGGVKKRGHSKRLQTKDWVNPRTQIRSDLP